jgi:hypothetical protein
MRKSLELASAVPCVFLLAMPSVARATLVPATTAAKSFAGSVRGSATGAIKSGARTSVLRSTLQRQKAHVTSACKGRSRVPYKGVALEVD